MSEWISTAEKLPAEGCAVLLRKSVGATQIGYLTRMHVRGVNRPTEKKIWHIYGKVFTLDAVTYWMRLPDPPEAA